MPKINHDTRANILKGALQLFLQKGYKDVSFRDIVEETGLSKGAIYHYFASKDELLVAVLEFLVEATKQPVIEQPQNVVKDRESFAELFINDKMAQIHDFRKLMGGKSFKINKLLFFIEAINESPKLIEMVTGLGLQEKAFIQNSFIGLKNNGKIPEGKDPILLADCLHCMLQGTELAVFFLPDDDWVNGVEKMYYKTLNDFFTIISA
ncbi:MAG TPA: TetR/AcrR family transcriptional regulator [Mucilaginibacter sp.]